MQRRLWCLQPGCRPCSSSIGCWCVCVHLLCRRCLRLWVCLSGLVVGLLVVGSWPSVGIFRNFGSRSVQCCVDTARSSWCVICLFAWGRAEGLWDGSCYGVVAGDGSSGDFCLSAAEITAFLCLFTLGFVLFVLIGILYGVAQLRVGMATTTLVGGSLTALLLMCRGQSLCGQLRGFGHSATRRPPRDTHERSRGVGGIVAR